MLYLLTYTVARSKKSRTKFVSRKRADDTNECEEEDGDQQCVKSSGVDCKDIEGAVDKRKMTKGNTTSRRHEEKEEQIRYAGHRTIGTRSGSGTE